MADRLFIVGDWGMTHLRLYLCEEDRIIDSVSGPGVSVAGAGFPETLLSLIRPWEDDHGTCPIYLTGAIGSSVGWIETPYAECPADRDALRARIVTLNHEGRDIHIGAGTACTNPLGGPDVMRGEETQCLGMMAREPALAKGRHLLCLPGTHSKWVIVRDGTIEIFLTGFTGELFALLRDQSVLVQCEAVEGEAANIAFKKGLARSQTAEGVDLMHLLFEVRSRQLRADLRADEAASFLSGLIIGRDVSASLRVFNDPDIAQAPVIIVGSKHLIRPYALALDTLGRDSTSYDGDRASVAGVRALKGMG